MDFVPKGRYKGGKFVRGLLFFLIIGISIYISSKYENLQNYYHNTSSDIINYYNIKPFIEDDTINNTYPEIRISSNCTALFDQLWIPEEGSVCNLLVEPGYIEVVDGYLDKPLPICLTQEEINDWFIKFAVKGGYELKEGGYVTLTEKDGTVTTLTMVNTYLGLCPNDCCLEIWEVRFIAPQTPICLDSSYFPVIYDGMWGISDEEPGDIIPGKNIDLHIFLYWMGCPQPDQSFTVKSHLIIIK